MNDVKNCVETLVRDCDEVIVAYNLAGDDTSYFTVNGNIGGVYGLWPMKMTEDFHYYVCHVCGRKYLAEEYATQCSELHVQECMIYGMAYSNTDSDLKYPMAVRVEFRDGTSRVYQKTNHPLEYFDDGVVPWGK